MRSTTLEVGVHVFPFDLTVFRSDGAGNLITGLVPAGATVVVPGPKSYGIASIKKMRVSEMLVLSIQNRRGEYLSECAAGLDMITMHHGRGFYVVGLTARANVEKDTSIECAPGLHCLPTPHDLHYWLSSYGWVTPARNVRCAINAVWTASEQAAAL